VFEFLDPTSHLSACGAELKLIQDSNAVKKIYAAAPRVSQG
jgi:hypothetical protein